MENELPYSEQFLHEDRNYIVEPDPRLAKVSDKALLDELHTRQDARSAFLDQTLEANCEKKRPILLPWPLPELEATYAFPEIDTMTLVMTIAYREMKRAQHAYLACYRCLDGAHWIWDEHTFWSKVDAKMNMPLVQLQAPQHCYLNECIHAAVLERLAQEEDQDQEGEEPAYKKLKCLYC